MSAPDHVEALEQAAADWDARLRSPTASDADRAAFKAWRAAAPEHAETYDRLQGLLAGLRTAGDRPELRALRDEAQVGVRRAQSARWGYGAAAAAALAVVVAGVALMPSSMRPQPAPAAPVVSQAGAVLYRTALNERSTVTLEDGSTITLDSATRVAASFQAHRRSITLLEGQALFHVARDPTRPFVVRAGDRTVTALGTVFDVRLDAGRMRVTLLEGHVAVRRVGGARADSAPVEHLLAPHQQLIELADNTTSVVRVADTDKATSWTEGRVFLEDEPLSQAIDEMNRYSATKVIVADASLNGLRINGMFRAGNQMGFVSALQSSLPVEARTDDQGRILLERRDVIELK